MRVIYFGDGGWATKCLQRLLEEGFEVPVVITRRKPSDSSLEEFSHQVNIPTRAPELVNTPEFVSWIQALEPDLNISMSYDQILRKPILNSAPLGFINCHAGDLPYYRGRNVINWAIINNEKEIGLTIHYIDEGIDTGDIILQHRLPIEWEDTYGMVLKKIRGAFPGLLVKAVRAIEKGEVNRQSQAHLEGTYFGRRVPGDEWIDWHDSSLNIYNKIRAISHPAPGARTLLDDRPLIVWQAYYELNWPRYIATPGEVVGLVLGQGVKVKTGDSILVLESVQFEGEAAQIPQFRIGTRFGLDLVRMMYKLQQEVAELNSR